MTSSIGFGALRDSLRGARVVDLTHTLDEEYPCTSDPDYAPRFKHVVHNWYESRPDDPQPVVGRSFTQVSQDGKQTSGAYYSCWMILWEHAGTHFDAPPHAIPPSRSGLPNANKWGDVYGEDVALDKLHGALAVLNVRHLRADAIPGSSPPVTVEHVQQWEREHGDLEPGDIFTFYTGWDEFYLPYPEGHAFINLPFEGRAPAWPAPNEEALRYLNDKGIETLGTDAPSIGALDDFQSVHHVGLGRGMVFIESLANLGELPARGAYFVFLPLKIRRSSGSSGRAIAWVP
jgi:kynurenine formamidase